MVTLEVNQKLADGFDLTYSPKWPTWEALRLFKLNCLFCESIIFDIECRVSQIISNYFLWPLCGHDTCPLCQDRMPPLLESL